MFFLYDSIPELVTNNKAILNNIKTSFSASQKERDEIKINLELLPHCCVLYLQKPTSIQKYKQKLSHSRQTKKFGTKAIYQLKHITNVKISSIRDHKF